MFGMPRACRGEGRSRVTLQRDREHVGGVDALANATHDSDRRRTGAKKRVMMP